MARLTRTELQALAKFDQGNCISIYFPTHEAGPSIEQDPIRFKNSLDTAEEQLVNKGVNSGDAKEILAPAYELDNDEFWRHQNNGLAIFIAPNFFRYYRLPFNVKEEVVVSNRFHVKPLLPLISNNGRFYILAISQDIVRLLEATRYQINEIDLNNLDEVPKSFSETVKREFPKDIKNRDQEEEIKRFFEQLNAGIEDLFREDDPVPLVLFGVEYLIPIYKAASDYPNLLEDAVACDPQGLKPKEIHEQAWKVVYPYFQKSKKVEIERFKEIASNNPKSCSSSFSEIVKAAYYSLIDTLLITLDEEQWGVYDAKNNVVELHNSQQADNEDMVDFVAVHTLINSGKVFYLNPEQMPVNSTAAAIFRSEIPSNLKTNQT